MHILSIWVAIPPIAKLLSNDRHGSERCRYANGYVTAPSCKRVWAKRVSSTERLGALVQRYLIERRAKQERQTAMDATAEQARKVHTDLANRYEEILRAYASDRAAQPVKPAICGAAPAKGLTLKAGRCLTRLGKPLVTSPHVCQAFSLPCCGSYASRRPYGRRLVT